MSDDLPEEFDLIVVGTGFTESCIAAAASRIGKTVLHIDANEYYGDAWSSFNLEAFNCLLEQPNFTLRNGSYIWHGPESKEENEEMEIVSWTRETLLEKSRRFSLDLSPRVAYSDGELVKLLIKSNICRYAEFRAVDHVCILSNDELVSVPCSRSDVFNTKMLTMVEKRMLMKFLTACNDYKEEDELSFRGRTFLEYLQAQRVTDKIGTCVMQAIAMCDANTSFEVGMQRTNRFLGSLGRYGNTPFLFPMYGSGELPQCFCRLCAVFGGVYCLKRSLDGITQAEQSNELLVSSAGKTLRAKQVVCAPAQLPASLARHYGELKPHISRGLFIAASPLGNEELNKGGGGVILLRLLAEEGAREACLLQLAHYSGTCPEGLYIFHLTTPAISEDPSADLAAFTAQLFQANAPQILYSAYFTLTAQTIPKTSTAMPICCTAAPTYELDYDAAIANARDIFDKLYGEAEEFLPRAPDPEEIVVEGEDPSALREHSLPEDLRAQLQQMDIAE
ncbi:rab proteins geranylgeranyltransferase component A [Drosophila grimshawi]|uniref:GH23002 n=1 Tax=Drosophila grimshawi TaxID=7222 RepID=B4JWA7_DROGR|nr:rab proteins geranylgeranyltransferase component A [Drosophila grimshawi]EDV98245.1 GH23002 [Drosophila grimshawi]